MKIKNSSLINVQLFVGTSCSFQISKAAVYICPFKTNDVKIKTIFFFESGHTYFSLKKNVIV